MELSLHLLGIPKVAVAGSVSDPALDKPASLLYYLAQRRDWISRSELAFLYRPDAPEKVALSNVRLYIHRAKERPWAKSLEVEKSRVRYQVDTDIQAFEEALEQEAWSWALDLYRGPFLEGISLNDAPGYETWLELERQDLSQKWHTAALNFAYELEKQKDFAGAQTWLERILKADPLDEECLQAFLRVLFATGKRSQALDRYQAFCEDLKRELDVKPLEATRALLESLNQSEPEVLSLQPPTPKRQHNLPTQTTRFVGRKRELAQLAEILAKADCRLLTLVGLGGVGKTRLALELASGQFETFKEGVWFVPLAGVSSPELLVSSIASAVGFSFSGSSDPKSQLGDFLREKDLLLFLDNFEHLLEGAVLLEELLGAAPKLKLLITSRAALELSAEWLFDLRGLVYPPEDTQEALANFDAVKLFNNRAERLSSTFVPEGETLTAVAELTRKVEGMPLALELAVTWTRSLGVPELLNELGKNIDLLSSQVRDFPERHRSLQTVFDYSWQRLTRKEQEALAKLSVFQGGFTLEAAEQVAGVHLALLLSLINHSLLQRNQAGRYQLHELVRQFAASQLPADLKRQTEASLSYYYLTVLTDYEPRIRGPRHLDAMNYLYSELDNLRLALDIAVTQAHWKGLGEALKGLRGFYWEANLPEEGRTVFERLVATLEPGKTPFEQRLLARSRLRLGIFFRDTDDFRTAQNLLEASIKELRQLGLKRDLARALQVLSSIARQMGKLSEAESYTEESFAICQDLEDNLVYAYALFTKALIKREQGQYQQARALLETCLHVREQRGDSKGITIMASQLGMLAREFEGNLVEARRYSERALALTQQLNDKKNEAIELNNLATIAFEEKNYSECERYLHRSLVLKQHLGNLNSQMITLVNLGRLHCELQDYDLARSYLRDALHLAKRLSSPRGQAAALAELAETSRRSSELGKTQTYLSALLELTLSAGIPLRITLRGLHILALSRADNQQIEEAFMLAEVTQQHKGTVKRTRDEAQSLVQRLEPKLSKQTVERLRAEAASVSLEDLLARQLPIIKS